MLRRVKTEVLLLPLLLVAFSCGEPSKEQLQERIDQSILSYFNDFNDWLALKDKPMIYEVKTTDFKRINAAGSPSSGLKSDVSHEDALYYTTTIVTKTVDSLVIQDTIHCTLDRSFNVIASTGLSTNRRYP
ncbi:hypothetical protein [Spirosoma jeollabukense]